MTEPGREEPPADPTGERPLDVPREPPLAQAPPAPWDRPFGYPSAGAPPVGHAPTGHAPGGHAPVGPAPVGQAPAAGATYAGPSRSATPGWLVPVLVGVALVTGLLGGFLGGALVLGTASTSGSDLPALGAAAPLPEESGSVAAVAQRVLPSTVQVRVQNGTGASATGATGSGFVIDDKGHVITNNHVVQVAEANGVITVTDRDGKVGRAEVVGTSPVYDLAVLKVDSAKGLPPVALGSSHRMHVGDTVVAIGSPLGLSSTVTSGIISALDRPVTTSDGSADAASFINAVQTDAAINPGNSGGPLVNLAGEVVGVNSAIATTGGAFTGQAGSIGVGFAIPMEQVRITANQILRTGRAQYPVIGASVDIGESRSGAKVTIVPGGSPAADAGIRKGDRIVAVDGTHVTDGIGLIVAIRSHRPGDRITLTLVRGGHQRNVEVTLDAKVG